MDIQTITCLFQQAYRARQAWKQVADKYRTHPSIVYQQELRTARAVYSTVQDMLGTMNLGPLWEDVLFMCEHEPGEDDVTAAIQRANSRETRG